MKLAQPLRDWSKRWMIAVSPLPVSLVLILLPLACRAIKPRPEGYRVVSYDAATYQWTILRNGTFDGKYLTKRLIVVCSFYKSGDQEPVTGSNACHLQVGRMIVPTPLLPEKRSEFIDVFEMPTETLAITEGYGPDRVSQQFNILKYEVLPDNGSE